MMQKRPFLTQKPTMEVVHWEQVLRSSIGCSVRRCIILSKAIKRLNILEEFVTKCKKSKMQASEVVMEIAMKKLQRIRKCKSNVSIEGFSMLKRFNRLHFSNYLLSQLHFVKNSCGTGVNVQCSGPIVFPSVIQNEAHEYVGHFLHCNSYVIYNIT